MKLFLVNLMLFCALLLSAALPVRVAVHGANAETVAEGLRVAGIEADVLTDRHLADGTLISAERYRVLLLLSAPDFPVAARDNFLKYLRDGGNFLAAGGMAFDRMQQEAFSGELLPSLDQWSSPESGDPEISFEKHADTLELKRNGVRNGNWLHAGIKIPAESGALYLFSGTIRSRFTSGGVGGYAAVRWLGADGKKIKDQWLKMPATSDWECFEQLAAAPVGTAAIEFLALLNGTGQSALRSPSARRVDPSRLLNARRGTFSGHGGVVLNHNQLPIFDPTHPFLDAVSMRPAAGQNLIPESFRFDGVVAGYPAMAKLGNNDPVTPRLYRTQTTLLETFDRFGKPRGSAGAIVHNFAGPFWRSSWALFGVSNFDLWREPQLRDALPQLIRQLADPVFLTTATPEYYSLRTGEPIRLTTRLVSRSREHFAGRLVWTLRDGERLIRSGELAVSLKPGAVRDFAIDAGCVDDPATLQTVEITLIDQTGTIRSDLRTGWVHFQPEALKTNHLKIVNNYFSETGPPGMFLVGSNQTGAMFHSEAYAPDRWATELDAMREHDFRILRLLHVTPTASPEYRNWNDNVDVSDPSESFLRKLDALVFLTAEHGIYLTLDISNGNGYNPLYGDDTFQNQGAEFARKLRERYRNAGNLWFDYRNEPQLYIDACKLFTTELKTLWKNMFHSEFTTTPAGGGFENRLELDRDRFLVELFQRYLAPRNAAQGGDAIRLMGYSAHRQIPLVRQFAHELSLNDAHFNRKTPDEMLLTLYDQRYVGTPPAIGEFGFNLEPYLSDRDPKNPMDEKRYAQLLRETALYAFSRGAASVCNWSLRDLDETIFPSGLWFPQNGGAKRAADDFGHVARFLGALPLAYVEPETALLYPINGGMGGDRRRALERVANAAAALERASIDFTVINDDQLRITNPRLRNLIYPAPLSMDDATYAKLVEFVRNGGRVFLSGDLNHDENHQPTRDSRREEFSGIPRSAQKIGVELYENKIGSGSVLFTPRPIEADVETLTERYRQIFNHWNVAPLIAPPLQAALQNGPAGERYYLLRNRTRQTASGEIAGLRFTLPPDGWTFAGFKNNGKLFALLMEGHLETTDGLPVFRSDFPVALRASGGEDIRNADRLEVTAFGAGVLTLANRGLRRARWQTGNGPQLDIRNSDQSITMSCDDDFIKGRILLEK